MEQIQGTRLAPNEMETAIFGKNSFFAHVISLNRQQHGEKWILKPTFKIASENSGVNGDLYKFEDSKHFKLEEGTLDKGKFVGMEVTHNGVWFEPNVDRKDAWKNKRYYEQMAVFMQCPMDEEEKHIPFLPELSDVIGKPCIIHFDVVMDKEDKDKSWNNLVRISAWPSGQVRMPQVDDAIGSMLDEDGPPPVTEDDLST